MTDYRWFDMQLFADGGDGGDGGDSAPAAESSNSGEDDVPAFIPEKAKETYRKAMAKNKPAGDRRGNATTAQPTNTEAKPEHVSYADLIKSDEYKEEHKAYMDKTIGERLKKYKGLEEKQSKSDELLSLVAQKYGLDTASDSFLDDLKGKVEADDSYYEQYAMDHDISTDEARHVVSLERQVAKADAEKRQAEAERAAEAQKQANMQRFQRLQQNAERTKQQFPGFNLETELKDERFAKLCAVNNDDTTAAYIACHHNEIIPNAMQMASQQAQIQTANAIASGKSRPRESGLTSNASAVVEQDFSKMNLQQLRAYAAEQRNKQRR